MKSNLRYLHPGRSNGLIRPLSPWDAVALVVIVPTLAFIAYSLVSWTCEAIHLTLTH